MANLNARVEAEAAADISPPLAAAAAAVDIPDHVQEFGQYSATNSPNDFFLGMSPPSASEAASLLNPHAIPEVAVGCIEMGLLKNSKLLMTKKSEQVPDSLI